MMKHNYYLVVALTIFSGASLAAKLKKIDGIDAVIFGYQETDIVTMSDYVNRLSLEGAVRTLDDVIFERLLLDAAAQYKIMPDERAVNSYLEMVQKENNLTLDDIKQMFMSSGRTFEEGRQELSRTFVANNLLDWKVRSRAVVTEKEVLAYYNAHPQYQEATWTFSRGFVPCAPEKAQAVKKQITDALSTGKVLTSIEWGDEFSIQADDIADDKKHILDLEVGKMCEPMNVPGGFELYQLISKKERSLVPMEERYRDIVRELVQPKYVSIYEDYKKQLYENSSIMYLKQ